MTVTLDRSVLAAATFGNETLEREVLALFRQQSAKLLRQLTAAGAAADQAEVLHTLKGSARSVGAVAVADLCLAFEQDLAAGQVAGFGSLADAIAMAGEEIDGILQDRAALGC